MLVNKLDIQQGKIKHFLYKSKVRSILYGGTVEDSFFLQAGPLGEWINNIGLAKYGTIPEMRTLESTHKELNNFAYQLAALYKRGRIQEAKDGMPKVEKYSDNILALFDAIEKYA